MISHDFLKVISYFILNKTHLISGSSNITSSENLAEKRWNFWNSFYIQLNLTPLEHYPILDSLSLAELGTAV